jgi:hypothetical protein
MDTCTKKRPLLHVNTGQNYQKRSKTKTNDDQSEEISVLSFQPTSTESSNDPIKLANEWPETNILNKDIGRVDFPGLRLQVYFPDIGKFFWGTFSTIWRDADKDESWTSYRVAFDDGDVEDYDLRTFRQKLSDSYRASVSGKKSYVCLQCQSKPYLRSLDELKKHTNDRHGGKYCYNKNNREWKPSKQIINSLKNLTRRNKSVHSNKSSSGASASSAWSLKKKPTTMKAVKTIEKTKPTITQQSKTYKLHELRKLYLGAQVNRKFDNDWYFGFIISVEEVTDPDTGIIEGIEPMVLFTDGDRSNYTIEEINRMLVLKDWSADNKKRNKNNNPMNKSVFKTNNVKKKIKNNVHSSMDLSSNIQYWCVHCHAFGPVNRKKRDEHYQLYHDNKYTGVKLTEDSIFHMTHPKISRSILDEVMLDYKILLLYHKSISKLEGRFGSSRSKTIRSLKRLDWMCASWQASLLHPAASVNSMDLSNQTIHEISYCRSICKITLEKIRLLTVVQSERQQRIQQQQQQQLFPIEHLKEKHMSNNNNDISFVTNSGGMSHPNLEDSTNQITHILPASSCSPSSGLLSPSCNDDCPICIQPCINYKTKSFVCQACQLSFHHSCCTLTATNSTTTTNPIQEYHIGNLCIICNQSRLLCSNIIQGNLNNISKLISIGIASPFSYWNPSTKMTPLHYCASVKESLSSTISTIMLNIMLFPYVVEGSNWQLLNKKKGSMRIGRMLLVDLLEPKDRRGLTPSNLANKCGNYTFEKQLSLRSTKTIEKVKPFQHTKQQQNELEKNENRVFSHPPHYPNRGDDISNGQESISIPWINTVDNELPPFNHDSYITTCIEHTSTAVNWSTLVSSNDLTHCNCSVGNIGQEVTRKFI